MAVESGARPSNTLSGELRTRPLAVLLAGACERGTSGTLTFRHGSRVHLVTMRAGKIAVARTSDPSAYLGGILYEIGAIDVPTLDASLHLVAHGKRLHGEVLIESGAITRAQLDEALLEQTYRKVRLLFALPDETSWSFRTDVDDLCEARDADRPCAETWHAIWRGLRDQTPSAHVLRTLSKIESGVHLKDLEDLERFGLSEGELALCKRLHDEPPMTLDRLLRTSPLSPDRTQLLVYLLALARSVVRVDAKPLGPSELGVEGIRERARQIMTETPWRALGLRDDASAEAARAAYYRQARLWHADKLPADLDAVRAECAVVYERLGVAYRTITDTNVWSTVDAVHAATGTRTPVAAANDSVAPPPLAAPIARVAMREIDAVLARGDLAAAEKMARTLTSTGDVGPAARAVIAWCALGTDTNTEAAAVDKALAALDKVLVGDPDCTHALFYRARIQQRWGKTDAAVRDYRRLLRLDPGHAEAQREVGLHDARRRNGSGELAQTTSLPPPLTSSATSVSARLASIPPPPSASCIPSGMPSRMPAPPAPGESLAPVALGTAALAPPPLEVSAPLAGIYPQAGRPSTRVTPVDPRSQFARANPTSPEAASSEQVTLPERPSVLRRMLALVARS